MVSQITFQEIKGTDTYTVLVRKDGKHWISYRIGILKTHDRVKEGKYTVAGKPYYIVRVEWWLPVGRVLARPQMTAKYYKHLKKDRARDRMRSLKKRIKRHHKIGYTSAVRFPKGHKGRLSLPMR